MSFGPGKYDDWVTKVRKETGASGVVLIVRNGCYGEGFSAQLSLPDHFQLPRILRLVADQIEADFGSVESYTAYTTTPPASDE